MSEQVQADQERKLDALARLVAGGGVTVLSGAGLSTASGLPDFRGRAGLWTEGDLGTLLTADGVRERFEEFTRFCRAALEVVTAHGPNPGHHAVASLVRVGLAQTVVTQNVDGYDREAGVDAVEVHGTLRRIFCSGCGADVAVASYLVPGGERCGCGGLRRPAIVLFGERLPAGTMQAVLEAASQTLLLLVLGTTLAVAPVSLLVPLVAASGGQIAILNNEPTAGDDVADIVIRGDLVQNLVALEAKVRCRV